MFGPATTLVRPASLCFYSLLASPPEAANFRYFLFNSPHMMIAVGTVVSTLCVPIAIQVARARPEELELPDFEAELAEEALPGEEATTAEKRDGSYEWSPK